MAKSEHVQRSRDDVHNRMSMTNTCPFSKYDGAGGYHCLTGGVHAGKNVSPGVCHHCQREGVAAIPPPGICPTCFGSGDDGNGKCLDCNGSGRLAIKTNCRACQGL